MAIGAKNLASIKLQPTRRLGFLFKFLSAHNFSLPFFFLGKFSILVTLFSLPPVLSLSLTLCSFFVHRWHGHDRCIIAQSLNYQEHSV